MADEVEKEEINDELLEGVETEEIIEPEENTDEPEENTDEPAAPAPTGKYVGQEIAVNVSGAEIKGLCVSERETNSGAQVFLQLNGCVSRWFNVEDIA